MALDIPPAECHVGPTLMTVDVTLTVICLSLQILFLIPNFLPHFLLSLLQHTFLLSNKGLQLLKRGGLVVCQVSVL